MLAQCFKKKCSIYPNFPKHMKNPKLPNPTEKHWFWGNLGILLKDMLPYMTRLSQDFEGFCWLTFPFAPYCFISNPAYIKHVLQDNNRNYIKGKAFRFLKPVVGEGLLTSEGEFWKRQRRLEQPAFHREKIAEMTQGMIELANRLAEEWDTKYKDGDLVNLSLEMNKIALEIVTNALFKSNIRLEQDSINRDFNFLLQRIMSRFRKPFQPPLWFPNLKNWQEKKAIRGLEKVIYSVIREKNENEQGSLLGMLKNSLDEQTGEKMSEKQIRDEIMTIFLAGHETSALSMAYSFFLFAQNPQVDQKIQTELHTILENKSLTFEKTKDLLYLRQSIQESLRLYPPAHILLRRALAPDRFGEYLIPADTNVIMSAYVMHRHPKYWENPEVFLPERFENERFKQIPKFAYFPFGGGQRLCIGDQFAMTEMLVVLGTLLQKFRFENTQNYPLELEALITLHPKKDIVLTLRKR